MNSLSRDCESYCIVPMEYCKENLNYAKKMNLQNRNKEEKLKDPMVLFNLAKRQNHRSGSPFLADEGGIEPEVAICRSQKLMSRY